MPGQQPPTKVHTAQTEEEKVSDWVTALAQLR